MRCSTKGQSTNKGSYFVELAAIILRAILEANAMRFSKFSCGIDSDGDYWHQCYDRGVRLRRYGTSSIQAFFALLKILWLLSRPRLRKAKERKITAANRQSAKATQVKWQA